MHELATARLRLRASDPSFAAAVADYYARNRDAHARWSPPHADSMFSAAGQHARLSASAAAIGSGTLLGWWLFQPGKPRVTLGQIHLSQLWRGPFCSAVLGYSIDSAHEGQGLMHEALVAALADAFERVGLHRVQAAVRPDNARSLALLDRLGFEREGVAREYLFIDGAWRDHVLSARRHPAWPADRPPPSA